MFAGQWLCGIGSTTWGRDFSRTASRTESHYGDERSTCSSASEEWSDGFSVTEGITNRSHVQTRSGVFTAWSSSFDEWELL